MAQLSEEELKQYSHSAVHLAIARRDHAALRRILLNLPPLPKAGEVVTEAQSIAAEQTADMVSAVIDRRDVPGRETPLHLAVRLGDSTVVEMLVAVGADWSLQNEQGWSALQEAVCAREEAIAKIMTRYYQPMAWAKWCRRLPRITSSMRSIRDLYMEITFNFESSVIPFIGRIAPSDTYRIWKRGSNLRADMTLAGFDGFKIQRSDQSFLFLGDGSEDGKLPSGSLLVLNHKDKQVMNALEGAGKQPSEAEIAKEVKVMSKTNMYRPGIDVTQAELIPQSTWRRQEKTEMVGKWKAKVYDMHHVMVSIRSRKVPGALSDEELLAAEIEKQESNEEDELANILTEEERQLLESVGMESLELSEESFDTDHHQSMAGNRNGYHDHEPENDFDHEDEVASSVSSLGPDQNGAAELKSSSKEGRKRWLLSWGRKTSKNNSSNKAVSTSNQDGVQKGEAERKQGHVTNSSSEAYVKSSGKLSKQRIGESENFANESNGESEKLAKESNGQSVVERGGSGLQYEAEGKRTRRGKEKVTENRGGESKDSALTSNVSSSKGNNGGEFKKGLRPVLWLTPDFPLKTEELLPLLDVLANKVKAVRRLRELLTTKLPSGTFPVKIAIPIVPTVRVVVTFNKFEELRSSEEFGTPLSSPAHFQDSKGNEADTSQSSSSWFSWIKGSSNQIASGTSSLEDFLEQEVDPFLIPTDYKWLDMNEKKRLMKAKRSKKRKDKKLSSKSAEGADNETRD